MPVNPYARSTRFRCVQGHGVWRRDELPIRRGSIVCPVGLRAACVCGLKMEPDGSELDPPKSGHSGPPGPV